MKSLIVLMCFFFLACADNSSDNLNPNGDRAIRLHWSKSYSDDSPGNALIGMQWALSYIGARLVGSPVAIKTNGDFITVDPDALGLEPEAASKLSQLHEALRNSDEYRKTGAVDAGRYVALLLGASQHYYAISGVAENLNTLLSAYELSDQQGYVNNSGVSLEHRTIRFSEQQQMNQVFLSQETDPVTGEIYEYETIELLANGQLRFGIFDAAGNRKNTADPSHSNAGKPAKCMWCHESKISQMFTPQQDFPGFLTYLELQDKLIGFNQSFLWSRASLQDGVDFSQTQQHAQAELLYTSFMEPSAARLALEWGISEDAVASLLEGVPTHENDEFPFLGALYHRNAIEIFAPFSGLPVSTNVREESESEVNHLN